jgi:protein involved in polysaccharide export with SLBB domain
VGSSEVSGDITYLTTEDLTGDYGLQHLDTITIPNITELRPAYSVNRIERTITISGAVRRPGTYELMPHENLKELIEVYADGFTALADPSRMEMVRLLNSEDIAGDKLFLTENDLANNYPLEHYDAIVVPTIVQLQPVMFVEGAIGIDIASNLTTTNRVVVQFAVGETYASLVRNHISWFTAVSDTQNAYIVRKGERIPINLNPMLYDAAYRDEVLVQENDVLVIPFRQYFVTVAGAVMNPGRYPYIPDRDWEYYVGLAGGFMPDRNFGQVVTIRDVSGKRLTKRSEIGPETVITASTNQFLFYFNQYAPVITTLFSIATTIISIQLMTR